MYLALGVIATLAALTLAAVGTYNGLISKRNRFKHAYAQIDVQLKRRYDLVPNLVELVNAHLKHESDSLEALIRARNAAYAASQRAAENAGDPSAMKTLANAEAALSAGLSRIIALSQRHPDLKADHDMRALNEELTTTEDHFAAARRAYNDCVRTYNHARGVFPALVLASAFGFTSAAALDGLANSDSQPVATVAS
jgi:LemA protein